MFGFTLMGDISERFANALREQDRDAALEGKDAVALKRVRRRIHRLKRQLRRATA